ncbi:MAG: ParB/RepB/Spo0J family partition protein [Gammaproteobacteria bacterium]|nr:ParB/RepB/Spo0J family partition protein [Gammaproteobacteria bacterium]
MTEEQNVEQNIPGIDLQDYLVQVPESDIQAHSAEPDSAFVESIRIRGLLEPVFLYDGAVGGQLEILTGNRRIGACRLLDYPILAYVLPGDIPREEAMLIALTSNLQRSRNRPDEARRIEELMGMGHTEQDIAKALGVRLTEIKSLVKMLKAMHPDVKDRFTKGELSKAAAKAIIRLPQEQQKNLLDHDITRVKEISQEVKAYQNNVFDQLDSIEVPGIVMSEELANQVEYEALKRIGEDRKVLLTAVAILRKKGETS